MANCCGGASSVVIYGEGDVEVVGSGTPSDPYIVRGTTPTYLRGVDTTTVSTKITGTGTINDPYTISATSSLGINDLVDVDGADSPAADNVIYFDGTKWTAGAAPVTPGAVNTAGGISGDGTSGDALKVAVSNTTDLSTTGLYTYIDSLGELRAERSSASSVEWSTILNKPTSFTPSTHTHLLSQVTGIYSGTSEPASSLGVNDDIYILY